jgi:hypothetical protein
MVMVVCFMRAPPPPADGQQTRGRNRERGKDVRRVITGNGAEHTDTGFTVCATNGGKHKDKLRV